MRRSVLSRAYVFVGLCLVAGSTIGQTDTKSHDEVCPGDALLRPCAERLINAAVNANPIFKIQLSRDAFKAGSDVGIWELTDTGVKPIGVGLKVFDVADGGIILKKELKWRLDATVTRVAYQADPNAQIAEFLWTFKDFATVAATMGEPGESLETSIARLAKCTGLTNDKHPGQALFRRYDDGWRLVNKPTICADKKESETCPAVGN
jgi:hypothetical protein